MTLLAFAKSSKPESEGYSGERLVNYFVRPSDAFAPLALLGRSGLVRKATVGGPVRAMIDNNGTGYLLASGQLWKVEGFTATALGAVADDPAAMMAASGSQVAIVAGGAYYLWDGATLATYATGAVTAPVSVTYQDGYFIVAGTAAGRGDGFTISALDDGRVFDAFDFAFAESSPDDLVAVISDHGQLYAFGKTTVEVFYNSGAAAFPFEPNRSAFVTKGCANGRTIAQEDNALFWLGQDGVVYRYAGASPAVVSTREIEEGLKAANVVSAFTFTDRGHKFYCIRCDGRPSFCYDITTGLWSERSTGNGPWIGTSAALVGTVQLIGTDTGAVCIMDKNTFTDDGAMVTAEAVSAAFVRGGARFTVAELYLMLETGDVALPDAVENTDLYDGAGVHLVDENGLPLLASVFAEPEGQIMLQASADGRTWSKERWRSMGRRGDFNKKIAWNGLGDFRRFQVRIRINDAVRRDVYGVTLV